MIRSVRPIAYCVYGALAVMSSQFVLAANTYSISQIDTVLPTIVIQAEDGAMSQPNTQKINRQQLDKAGAHDLKTLLRYEPGVEVEAQAGLNNGNFNIRGISEDRVWVMVDGLNLPDSFKDSFWYGGGGARAKNGMTFGQNLVETDTINSVSVVKGPFEAQHSGEAIGGSVNMQTYRPEDLIAEGNTVGALFKSGYNSGNQGWGNTIGGAAQGENASGLLMYTHRQYGEIKTAGKQANEQDNDSNNVLLKGTLDFGEHQLSATGEYFKRDGASKDLLVSDSFDDTASERLRGSVQYQYLPDSAGALQALKIGYDHQSLDSEMLQMAPNGALHQRHLQAYQQVQDRAYAHSLWQFDAGVDHHVLAGLEYRRVNTATDRHSANYDASGQQVGSVDDLLYYPENERDIWSVFVQDRMVFDNGISLTPAVRYTHETSTPNQDDFGRLKNQANVDFDTMIAKRSYSQALPSLKLNVPLNDTNQLFASYAKGYKTPQFDAQGAASHSVLGGRIQYYNVPNFDLKPEQSDNFEFGWQHDGVHTHAKITGFYNRYKNFIQEGQTINTFFPSGRPPFPMVMELSSVNLDKVVTYGIEARGQYDFAEHWNVNGSFFWMRGTNQDDNSHLNSALPMKARLGVGYATEVWGANADWTLSAAKTKYATADQNTPKTPGYGLLDLGAFWNVNKHTKLSLNAYNVLNKKYWLPADMLWLNTTGQMADKDSYTQMGRAIGANLQIKF